MKGQMLALVTSIIMLLSFPVEVFAVKQTIVQKPENVNLTAEKQQKRGSRDSSDSFVRFVRSLLGLRYRWGGESQKGFDCSGLTRYVFKKTYGINLPHTAAGQSKLGRAVQRHQLIPGDIVYFKTSRKRAGHVGIFIGGDLFIHSTNPQGVVISSLNESYYRKRYKGGRRIGR